MIHVGAVEIAVASIGESSERTDAGPASMTQIGTFPWHRVEGTTACKLVKENSPALRDGAFACLAAMVADRSGRAAGWIVQFGFHKAQNMTESLLGSSIPTTTRLSFPKRCVC